jgi:hypothetical protein
MSGVNGYRYPDGRLDAGRSSGGARLSTTVERIPRLSDPFGGVAPGGTRTTRTNADFADCSNEGERSAAKSASRVLFQRLCSSALLCSSAGSVSSAAVPMKAIRASYRSRSRPRSPRSPPVRDSFGAEPGDELRHENRRRASESEIANRSSAIQSERSHPSGGCVELSAWMPVTGGPGCPAGPCGARSPA